MKAAQSNLNISYLAKAIFVALMGSNFVTPIVLAQDNPEQRSRAETEVEVVTITAERRGVREDEMPISIMGFSGDALESKNITDIGKLQQHIPNLQFSDNGNSKFINIRGVGLSEGAPNQTNGVAVHLDGAYVAREFVYGDAFFDLASVEVLRGPQGTYSGQNANGGAIFINSRKPVLGETDGFVTAEMGSFNLNKFGAGFSFPLAENLAMRISGSTETRDSFYTNFGADPTADPKLVKNQPGNLERSLNRYQLLYTPTEFVELRLIHDRSRNYSDGVPTKRFNVRGDTTIPTEGVWHLNYDMEGQRKVIYERTTFIADWQASDSFKVLSNFSFFDSVQDFRADGDYGSYLTISDTPQSGRDFRILDEYWTAEVNLVSTLDGSFEWTAGFSYLDYEQDNYLNNLQYNNAAFPGTALNLTRHTRQFIYLNNIRKNKAIFGEVGQKLSETVELKVGLRYNQDQIGFTPDSYIQAGSGVYNATTGNPFPQQDLFDFSATTGRVVLNWSLSDGSLAYATVGKGYKPGGTSPFGPEYESEFVLNKEIGWKGKLFNGNINTSIALFHMDYDNFQRTFRPPENSAASITRNVDGSVIQGLEVQFRGIVSDIRWDASFAYNDGKYGDLSVVIPAGAFVDGVNPGAETTINLKGKPIDFLPEFSASLGLEYWGWELGKGHMTPSLRMSHQTEYYTSFYQLDYHLTPSRTLFDFNLAYEHDSGWRADFYIQNLADKLYPTRVSGGTDGIGLYELGAPRQIGMKVKYAF